MVDQLAPKEIIARAERLKADRSTTESHWQEIADHIMPSREFQGSRTPGDKRQARIYHTGPVLAAEQQAGALHGMLTSPALRWFALRPSDPAIADDVSGRAWFDAASEAMYRMFTSPRAKFDLHLHENYLDQAGFGTSVLFVNDRGLRGPGFKALPLAECVLSENDEGEFDTLYRCFTMRARDVVEKWPGDVSSEAKADAERRPDERWECVHAVMPDDKRRGMYVGTYVLKRDMRRLGEVERYEERPFVASRWARRSGETYGSSCAMNALPDIKRLNLLAQEELRGVMLATRPPIALPDDGFLTPISMAPGRVHYYRAEMQGFNERVFPLPMGERPDIAAEKIQRMEDLVDRAFYIHWMNLPFRPNMTATEVIQRRDDMLRLMGPMVSRLQAELLGPVIERAFAVMWRNGFFPPAPSVLNGARWHVEYLSPLALAQRSQDAQGALQFMAALGQIAAGDPTVLDIVDSTEMGQFLAERMGAPMKALRSDEAIADLRQARAERDQQMQNAMAAESMTKSLQQGGAGAASIADALASMQGAGAAA